MAGLSPLRLVIDKMLQTADLSFLDFMELALYHPEFGYYASSKNPVGRDGDYITSPLLSPVFSFALARLIDEFLRRDGDEVSTVVDIGCGDGSLIHSLYGQTGQQFRERTRFYGVDRSLSRVRPADERVRFVRSLEEIPRDGAHILISNELFDSFPFARLVQRDEHLHELWVTLLGGDLEWTEHEAAGPYEDYFAERRIELSDGQFADVSLEWGDYYRDLCAFVHRGMIVTLDYGFTDQQLFHPRIRRFGTAASYAQQRVTRDLLSEPGAHDITAHINFSDLVRAGEESAMKTLFFDRQAKFLLSLGAAEHEIFRPIETGDVLSLADGVGLLERREEARRLILPDGIGEDIRVLVQSRGMSEEPWSFQRKLF